MNKGISLFAGLTALFAMGSAQQPSECPEQPREVGVSASNINADTGHIFEVYKADGICWDDARRLSQVSNVVTAARTLLPSPRDHHLVQREQVDH